MKYKQSTFLTLSLKRFRRRQKSKHKAQQKKFKFNLIAIRFKEILGVDYSYYDVLNAFLPKNLKYLVFNCESSHINIVELYNIRDKLNDGKFVVPNEFSIISNPEDSFAFIKDVTSALLMQTSVEIVIDYSKCVNISLETQVYFDAIIKDVLSFYKRCREFPRTRPQVKSIKGAHVYNEQVKKLLFSVGSPVIHAKKQLNFKDIVAYKLCIHNALSNNPRSISKKELDTTIMADYVIDSLARLNRKLTDDTIEDLCIVISEILINAEEHSTNKYRYSIGYFNEKNVDGKHFGVFRLVILNFGQTIYEKFKDPACPNQESIEKMKALSDSYNKGNFFTKKEFEEETLWTLYSLQEGITSTDPNIYKRRGNGSIRFIESFFNIKGEKKEDDDVSNMTLLSGNSQIIFDGTYNIVTNKKGNDKFQLMTFNESGNIMKKPDHKFVKFVPHYFPGTLISAEILFDENDLEYGN